MKIRTLHCQMNDLEWGTSVVFGIHTNVNSNRKVFKIIVLIKDIFVLSQ